MAPKIRRSRHYVVKGNPTDEIVRVLGYEREVVPGEVWLRVRFLSDGARLVMHPSEILAEVPR